MNPILTKAQVHQLDTTLKMSYDLNNKKYLPGFIGLNNVKANDYVNVVIQALAHIPSIRDYFILEDFEKKGSSQLGMYDRQKQVRLGIDMRMHSL